MAKDHCSLYFIAYVKHKVAFMLLRNRMWKRCLSTNQTPSLLNIAQGVIEGQRWALSKAITLGI